MGRRADKALKSSAAAADPVLPRPPDPTVRVVRADCFTTKGQGFLYVEARTTQGAQTQPGRRDDARERPGSGTSFISARTMSRFDDSGVYMFHRNLFKVASGRTRSASPEHRRRGGRQGLRLAA